MPILPATVAGAPALMVHMRRSVRAKRFSLRVSRLDGKITLTLPERAREKDALRFLQEQEAWLRATLAEMPSAQGVNLVPGVKIPVEGRFLTLTPSAGRRIEIVEDRLLMPGDPAQYGQRLGAFLKVLARDRLARASSRYAAAVGRDYSRLTLRDTRSRWGSCSYDRALMYSWRLIMAPPSVLDYVAAHEVAHLVEMNHSPDFWAVVSRICPNWQAERNWLRQEGQDLHLYRFKS